MVKRALARKASKARLDSVKALARGRDGDSGISKQGGTMHRGRRKRLEAKQRLREKKMFIAAELEKIEEETQKKRDELNKKNAKKGPLGPALAIMSEMANALPDVEKKQEKDSGEEKETVKDVKPKLSKPKQRLRLVAQETEQLNSVREHPVFEQNPMEALRQHLMNTVSCDPTEIPPPLTEGDAGAPKGKRKRKKKRGEVAGAKNEEKSGARDTVVNAGLVLDRDYVDRVREEARERVAEKRERKAALAEAAAKLQRKKQGSKIEKQTLSGLISKSRGRIGVKRPKALE